MGSRAWLILACAILVPWQLWNVASHPQFLRPPLPIGDGPDYETIGYSLSVGKGFAFALHNPEWRAPYLADAASVEYLHLRNGARDGPTTSRPPLLPFVISIVYRCSGRTPTAFATIRCISAISIAISGAIAVFIAFVLTRKLAVTHRTAHLAAVSTLGLAFFDSNTRTYAIDFLSEPLAMLWATLFLLVALSLSEDRLAIAKIFLLSLFIAAMVATRSMIVFWLPMVTIILLMSLACHRKSRTIGFLVLVVLLLSPWCVRNCLKLQSFMPMGAQGAASILGGYSDEALADGGNWHSDAELRLRQRLGELPLANEWTNLELERQIALAASVETKKWIDEHRPDLPYLFVLRLKSHWGPYFGKSLLWRIGMILGVIAIIVGRRREALWMLGLPIASSLTVMCLYETGGRFLVPLYGLLYALAGIGFAATMDWLTRIVKAISKS